MYHGSNLRRIWSDRTARNSTEAVSRVDIDTVCPRSVIYFFQQVIEDGQDFLGIHYACKSVDCNIKLVPIYAFNTQQTDCKTLLRMWILLLCP